MCITHILIMIIKHLSTQQCIVILLNYLQLDLFLTDKHYITFL